MGGGARTGRAPSPAARAGPCGKAEPPPRTERDAPPRNYHNQCRPGKWGGGSPNAPGTPKETLWRLLSFGGRRGKRFGGGLHSFPPPDGRGVGEKRKPGIQKPKSSGAIYASDPARNKNNPNLILIIGLRHSLAGFVFFKNIYIYTYIILSPWLVQLHAWAAKKKKKNLRLGGLVYFGVVFSFSFFF